MADPQGETPTDAERVAEVMFGHRLHASMNLCQGCPWRPTSGAGSLADQHRSHVAEHVASVVRDARATGWDRGYLRGVRNVSGQNTDNPYRTKERDHA